jgi:hypothetical protein
VLPTAGIGVPPNYSQPPPLRAIHHLQPRILVAERLPPAGYAEDPQATVASGTVGYWPPGKAVCLFFGQQPVSPVNLIGALTGDAVLLRAVCDGQLVRLERLAG